MCVRARAARGGKKWREGGTEGGRSEREREKERERAAAFRGVPTPPRCATIAPVCDSSLAASEPCIIFCKRMHDACSSLRSVAQQSSADSLSIACGGAQSAATARARHLRRASAISLRVGSWDTSSTTTSILHSSRGAMRDIRRERNQGRVRGIRTLTHLRVEMVWAISERSDSRRTGR